MSTCETCRFWDRPRWIDHTFGRCTGLMSIAGSIGGLSEDAHAGHIVLQEKIAPGALVSACVAFITPATFGCVHHQERT